MLLGRSNGHARRLGGCAAGCRHAFRGGRAHRFSGLFLRLRTIGRRGGLGIRRAVRLFLLLRAGSVRISRDRLQRRLRRIDRGPAGGRGRWRLLLRLLTFIGGRCRLIIGRRCRLIIGGRCAGRRWNRLGRRWLALLRLLLRCRRLLRRSRSRALLGHGRLREKRDRHQYCAHDCCNWVLPFHKNLGERMVLKCFLVVNALWF